MISQDGVLLECQLADTAETLLSWPRQPELLRLLGDWQAIVTARGQLPRRADFSPEQLRYMLGHVVIFEVVNEAARRFRYRLYGSHFTFARGFDLTGKFLEDHPDPHFSGLAARQLGRGCDTRLPVFGVGQISYHGLRYEVEALSLPLAEDGVNPDLLLMGQYEHRLDPAHLPLRVNVADPPLLRPWLENDLLRQIFDDWCAIAASRPPQRADFPPERLRPWLGHVLLCEQVGERLRYRLVGSHLTSLRGFDPTGRHLDEHPDPEFGRAVQWLGLKALRLGRPARYRGDGYTARGLSLNFEGLGLPLANADGIYDSLLAVQLPLPDRA